MRVPAERMKRMRKRRRQQDLRELRLYVPDSRLSVVRARIAEQVARLDPADEREALEFIEASSEFDAPDLSGA
jgi:hypothetical protein